MSLDPDIELALSILREKGVLIELSRHEAVATEDLGKFRSFAIREVEAALHGEVMEAIQWRDIPTGHHTHITAFLAAIDMPKIHALSTATTEPAPAAAPSSPSPASSPTDTAGSAPTPNGNAAHA